MLDPSSVISHNYDKNSLAQQLPLIKESPQYILMAGVELFQMVKSLHAC